MFQNKFIRLIIQIIKLVQKEICMYISVTYQLKMKYFWVFIHKTYSGLEILSLKSKNIFYIF